MTRNPSTAQAPDLDWSQIRETVRMLQLAVAQIELAMRDGEDSVNTLSNSFTSMVGGVNVIALAATELPPGNLRDQISSHCGQVLPQMQGAIVAFQFYDKLSQQLRHVAHSLDALGDLVSDQQRLYSPFEWRALQLQIRSRYSMKEEQQMFDALLVGASVGEALALLAQQRASAPADEIELF